MTRRYAGETLRKGGGLNEGHTSDYIAWVTMVTEYCKEVTTCNDDTERMWGAR